MATVGTVNYGNFAVVPGYDPASTGSGDMAVAGNLFVGGRLVVRGESDVCQKLQQENDVLRKELDKLRCRCGSLERMVDMMWHSPGMPGFVMAENSFYETAELLRAPELGPVTQQECVIQMEGAPPTKPAQ
jgi:hypothetical protein